MIFTAVCTGTRPGGSCPQGRGPLHLVAGPFGDIDRDIVDTHRHHHHHQAVCLKRALVLRSGACTMDLNGRPMADRATGAARRRRERRLPPWWRHEQMSIACALAEALHYSSGTKPSTCDTKVVEGAKNDALRGQNTVTRAREGEVREEHHAPRGQTRPLLGVRPAPVQEPRSQEGIQRHTGVGFELVLDPVVPQMAEQLLKVVAPAAAVFQASSPAVEYFAPAPAVFQASSPVAAVFQASSSVVEHLASAPALFKRQRLRWSMLHPRLLVPKRLRQ